MPDTRYSLKKPFFFVFTSIQNLVSSILSIMGTYHLIDHTADIGIFVEASDLKDLFETSARAMFSQMFDLSNIKAKKSKEIKLEGENTEDLLVRWLNELLFISESGYIPGQFHIKNLQEHSLNASVKGENIDLREIPLKEEIKAATYHQLEIKKNASGEFQTTIIFDV